MKRTLFVWLLLGGIAAGGVLTYQAASRDQAYRAYLERGDAALGADQTFGAIEAYSGAVALRPDSMLAHLRRGETYQRRGDLEAAARDFQAAAALDPTAIRPLEELGDIRYLQQRFRRAAEIYEQYVRLDDRAAPVTYKLALARYRADDLGGAAAALDAVLRLDDQMADAHYLRALCLRGQRRPDEAQRALERAIALAPGFVAAREELADLFGSIARRDDELEQLQLLAGLERAQVERQVAVGRAHARWAADPQEPAARRAGHADLAVLTLGSVLERMPDQPLIYGALGGVWLELAQARGDRVALNKALQALEHVGSSNAATSEALTLYGRALIQAGRSDVAERTLQQAIGRFPVEPSAFLLYAQIAEQQNHLDAARHALIGYGAITDDDAGFADRAARIAAISLKLNDSATAATWIDRGLQNDPGHAALLALQRRLPR